MPEDLSSERSSPLAQARAALEDGRLADAEDVIRKALGRPSLDTPTLLITLADVLKWLDRYDEADEVLQRLERGATLESGAAFRLELSLTRADLARTRGNDALASALAEPGLASARALGEARLEAGALQVLADGCGQGDRARNEELLRAALTIVENLPSERWWRIRLLVEIADLRRHAQKFDEAEALLLQARDLSDLLRRGHPAHVGVSRAFGILREDQGRFADAESHLRQALAQSEASYGPNDSSTASISEHLASLLVDLNSYDEADALLDDAQRIRDAVDGPDHPTNWGLLQTRAQLRTAQGRYEDAEHLYARAIHHAQSQRGPESLEILGLLKNAAILARDRRNTDLALALYAQAQSILEQHRGKGDIQFASLFGHLGDALSQDGKYAEAEAALDKAIGIYEATVGAEHYWTLRTRIHRAYAISNLDGRALEAEAEYGTLLEQLTGVVGPEHEDVGWLLRNIGELYVDTRRWPEALRFLTRALTIFERTRGEDHAFLVWPLRLMGAAHLALGQVQEAVRLLERAVRIRELRNVDDPVLIDELADVYERTGRAADGAALRARGKHGETKPRLS